jgi:hypothetical protein
MPGYAHLVLSQEIGEFKFRGTVAGSPDEFYGGLEFFNEFEDE